MIQIIKASDDTFKPHIALCHMEYNGGSANKENVSLVMKAKQSGDNLKKVLKQLGIEDSVLQKASYQNLRSQLEAALRDVYNDYVYVEDFDPEKGTVVFEAYKNDTYKMYSTGFSVGTGDIVSLEGEAVEVVGHKVYTTVEEGALLLKSLDESTDEESDTTNSPSGAITEGQTSDDDNKEEDMSDNQNIEQIVKEALAKQAAESADQLIKAKAQWDAEAAEAVLVKSTTEIVKGFDCVEEADLEVLVKALVGAGESSVFVKAMSNLKDKVTKAEADVATIQKEFADKDLDTKEGNLELEALSDADQLAKNIQLVKAAQAEANK